MDCIYPGAEEPIMYNTIRKVISGITAFVLFAVLLLPSFQSPATAANTAAFNVLVYMVASDLESKENAATNDIEEMLSAAKKMGNNINLIVYAGGTKEWHNDIFSSKENRCVRIGRNGAELLYSEETRNMTDPDTLLDFLNYCRDNYPAERNMLIFWDHGGGGIGGFGVDELNDNDSPLNMLEIYSTLQENGVIYDIVGFDACMMASIETALTLMDSAKYMVASEEIEPCSGWNYKGWLSKLIQNPKIDTQSLCRIIADTYIEACKKKSLIVECAMSVTDLGKVKSSVPQALSEFSKDILDRIENGSLDVVKTHKALTVRLLKSNGVEMLDAVSLAEGMSGEHAKNFAKALRSAIVYNTKFPKHLDANGLSIYVPIKNMYYSGSMGFSVDELTELGIEKCYAEWLSCVTKYLGASNKTAEGGRTFLDVLTGTVRDTFLQKVEKLVNKNKLNLENSYIWYDRDGIPQLSMSDENKELCLYLFQEIYVDRGEKAIDFGMLTYDINHFVSMNSSTWGTFGKRWLTVNGKFCPFYMEDFLELEDGRFMLRGHTTMNRNGEYGWLYLNIYYDGNDETVSIEPQFYQGSWHGTDDGKGMFDRISYVSDISGDDEIFFYGYSSDGNETTNLYPATGTLHWNDDIKFEWKEYSKDTKIKAIYSVMDLYGLVYELKTEQKSNQN